MCSMLLLEEDQNLLMDIRNHIYVDMEYITEKVYPNHKKKSVYYRLNHLVQEKYLKNELLPLPVSRSQVRKSGRLQNVYKWKYYQSDIILFTVRWYLRYNLIFRDLVEMMAEQGLSLAHTTIMRWVHQYGPELNERIRNMLALNSLQTATKMITGIEAMHMVKKGQILQGKKHVQRQIYRINKLFDLTV